MNKILETKKNKLAPCWVLLELVVVQVEEEPSGHTGRHNDPFLDLAWGEEVDLFLDHQEPVLGYAGVPDLT